MRKFLILVLLFASLHAFSQVTPVDEGSVNYRIIGFSFPARTSCSKYSVEIAEGRHLNNEDFKSNIIVTASSKKNKIIAEVPFFGKVYTWRPVYMNGSTVTNGPLHYFSTDQAAYVNTDSMRLNIITPAVSHKDDYIFIDGTKTLYDMNGKPVWFLPEMQGPASRNVQPRDMKGSPWGTITFMVSEHMYEISYNGDIVWMEPKMSFKMQHGGDRIANLYHHEFMHLPNDHYMALGMENTIWDLPDSLVKLDSNKIRLRRNQRNQPRITHDSGIVHQRIMSGRIIEFDQNHNIVWSWRSSDYFKESDLFLRRRKNGLYNVGNAHENAIFFDEKHKAVYLSFRNLNRVVKIDYPSGKVLYTFGVAYSPAEAELNNDIFCGQHSCKFSSDGYLYLYNNNFCNHGCAMPSIVMIKEPESPDGQMEKVWEYKCTIPNMSDSEQLKLNFETGGDVVELPDHAILCCMAGMYSYTFIVNRDKEIQWSALPEKYSYREKTWKPIPSYRASIITRKELESIIWGETLKK